MADLTIDQLTDIGTNQQRSAETIIQQDGVSFRAPVRPNPPTQINVSSQAQLEVELGVNLEIADNQRIVIVLDDAFTLTKPIKLGLNVGLEVYASVNGAFLSYTGTGALFQNTNPANLTDSLNLHNLSITGDGTNSIFDIVGNSVVEVRNVVFSTFNSTGIIESLAAIFELVSFINLTQGLVVRNTSDVSILRCSVVQFSGTEITAFSIITNIVTNVDIDIVRALSFFAGDSLVFFDPNSPAGSIYTIEKSNVVAGDLYQQGEVFDIVFINEVSGNARFATDSVHDFILGAPVVISGFVTNTAYNGTFIVTEGGTNQFQTGVAFGTNESGAIVTKTSLDSTDPIVFAEGNNGSLDSQTIAESRTSGTLEVDGSGGIDVPIVDITPVAGDWVQDPSTERFSVDTTTGLVTYIGITPITVMITYSLSVEAASGPAQDLIIDLHINGIAQTKASVSINASSPAVPIQYNGGNFSINPGDTFQLFKDNTTNTNNTNVSNATLLINL